jgi:S1-C subfamily serine protease
LDSAGRLIGVNTAIYSPSGASAGIGFAIPIDSVNRTVTRLIKDGRIVRPGLNINIAPDTVTQKLGIKGVLILAVLNGGAADKAGLQPTTEDEEGIHLGDILTAINGRPIHSQDDLLANLEDHEVGDVVRLKILRDANSKHPKELEVKATLQAMSH